MNHNILYFIFEIILEQLPISSSGHMQLIGNFINLTDASTISSYLAHIFLLGIYLPFIFLFIYQTAQKSIRLLFSLGVLTFTMSATTIMMKYLSSAISKYFILSSFYFPLWLGFLITTGILYIIKIKNKGQGKPYYRINFTDSVIIGIAQSLAFLPGISRMSIVILASILQGYKKESAFYISIISNSYISIYSIFYLLYNTNQNTNIINIQFSLFEIIYMQIAFFVAIAIFYIIKNILEKNKIAFIYKYELCIALISLYFKI